MILCFYDSRCEGPPKGCFQSLFCSQVGTGIVWTRVRVSNLQCIGQMQPAELFYLAYGAGGLLWCSGSGKLHVGSRKKDGGTVEGAR